jgi:hypothetical protein
MLRLLVCAIVAFSLGGCAFPGFLPNTATGSIAPRVGKNGEYILTAEELAPPCSKLRGRIQLRVLEVRDRSMKGRPSTAAQTMRWASDTTGMWRKSSAGESIGSSHDVAVLTAYNTRLGQLGCPQYDIKTELSTAGDAAWQIR